MSDSTFQILDLIIVAALLYYGWKFWRRTPPFRDPRAYNAKCCLQCEAAWTLGHRLLGKLFLALGLLAAATDAVRWLWLPESAAYFWATLGVQLALLIASPLIVNAVLARRFDGKGHPIR